MFWRCWQGLGGEWHFWRVLVVFWRSACSILEGRGILEEVLAVVLEGCGTFGGRLQCFGGA